MIHRIEVRARGESDPRGSAVARQIAALGYDAGRVRHSRVYLIDSDAADVDRAAGELLADPVVEHTVAADTQPRIEIHLRPGVMDPVAGSTEAALRDAGVAVREVRTGRAYVMERSLDNSALRHIAERLLANDVIETVHYTSYTPQVFESARESAFKLRHVPLTTLTDAELGRLSREGHLFLSLAEMRAIQHYFRTQEREPTDIELETLAQTWSEHCVHKTLKSAVEVVDEHGNPLRRYENLIGETIFASTMTLMQSGKKDFCLSVFQDNAGVIAFDETDAVCFKVETHNHPSAIEPYGGAATGVGGVIRDVLATGLGAKPIGNTDVFCVAYPERGERQENAEAFLLTPHPSPLATLPQGIIHPKRVLQQVVAGVRDYGNRMGIPTVNGAIYFDENYLGNPLVFCGCAGLLPRDKIAKQAHRGDLIVLMGGRTGRDGIHGATFSSAELTDTHADEFGHAVQIGNAITEKKVQDVLLVARDRGLFSAVTDCGAGGLSSAIGEMGAKLGARVDLDLVPLKYAGLRYDEIWISEAQERMVLAVPKDRLNELLELSQGEHLETTVIGEFGTDGDELILKDAGEEVGRMAMAFLHDGLPKSARRAQVASPLSLVHGGEGRGEGQNVASEASVVGLPRTSPPNPLPRVRGRGDQSKDFTSVLLQRLAHPNIASKHWIIRQYDHEVGGGTVVKPLVGPLQLGPSDAAVIRPKHDSYKGVALGCGLAPQIDDPYEMALASIDEAIRNVIAVGADYNQIAILDNFCWPSVDDEITMGTLVRACEACRDAALAYGIPFISGKDSLHNQFTDRESGRVIKIPRTLLISAIGIVPDIRRCVTMDFKKPNQPILLYEPATAEAACRANVHRAVAKLIADGHVAACHDVSDGGIAVAAAEMAIASGIGVNLDPRWFEVLNPFEEKAGRYLIELNTIDAATAVIVDTPDVRKVPVGRTQHETVLSLSTQSLTLAASDLRLPIDSLTRAWRGTLDW